MGKKSKKKTKKGRNGGGNAQHNVLNDGGVCLRAAPLPIDESRSTYGGLPEMHTDEVGRMFCVHNRDYCHICHCDHRPMNRTIEEEAGLRKKTTPVEEAAKMYATASRALRGMERMKPRPSEEVFEENRRWKEEQEEKLRRFQEEGEDVEAAIRRAVDEERSSELEMEAMVQSMSRLNPGQTEFEFGGAESQRIYDEFVKGPKEKSTRCDIYTCSYCGDTGTKKLQRCSRCQKAHYCSTECQKAAWPAHKKECVRAEKEPKKLNLTWEQVEAHSGAPAKGVLEVKAIKDESMMRQVFQCKDRVGSCRRIAAYTNDRRIPGLCVGATVKWKNPRFHFFMDGSSGARIEEEDLEDLVVS